MSSNAGIVWDLIIPLELVGSYKPHPDAYRAALKIFPQFQPHQFLMVTANPTFGDIEGAAAIGMRSQVIRQPDHPQTIIDLAFLLAQGSQWSS